MCCRQVYGYSYLPLFISLSTLSLFNRISPTARSTKSPFTLVRKPLRLVVDDIDEQSPTDIAFVFSGYAPLSVRLVQCAVGRGKDLVGWKGFEEVLKTLPGGPSFEEYQRSEGREAEGEKGKVPTTIVCFLGGITYAEISALRFLNRQNPRSSCLSFALRTISSGRWCRCRSRFTNNHDGNHSREWIDQFATDAGRSVVRGGGAGRESEGCTETMHLVFQKEFILYRTNTKSITSACERTLPLFLSSCHSLDTIKIYLKVISSEREKGNPESVTVRIPFEEMSSLSFFVRLCRVAFSSWGGAWR